MNAPNLIIRRMAESELSLALDLAAAEGWNPGLYDAPCFYAADPRGFFLAELGGEPAGTISAVAYDAHYGFIGLYIVRPQYRGRGVGLRLWDAAMRHLQGRNIGLDGVIALQEKYGRSGFQFAFRNIRHQGEGGGAQPSGLTDLSSASFDELARYDATIFPASRQSFLQRWIAQPQAAALGFFEGRRLQGYGVLRACRSGFKIGPLFADEPRIADALFKGLAARAPGQPVILDTPQANPAAIALAKRHGMAPVFETARMYTSGCREKRLDRCFGVTTFELG